MSELRTWVRALAQPTTYLGIAMLTFIAVMLTYLTHQNHTNAVEEARRQGDNLARLFEQFVTRSIKSADATILLLRRSYQHDPANTNLVEWATDPELKNDLTFQYSIVGPDGAINASSFGPDALGINISDRFHFQFHAQGFEDRLHISEPVTLRTSGQRTIILSRRLTRADGSFDGVLTASFDLAQLETFYRSLDLGESGLISLLGLDGIIRAAGGNGQTRTDLIGRKITHAGIFDALRVATSGSYWNEPHPNINQQRVDGVKRLVSYKLVEAFPLVAIAAISEETVLRHASQIVKKYRIIATALTIGILLAIGLAVMRERRLIIATGEIEYQAYHDELTGLANRALFGKQIERALRRALPSGRHFNVLLLDLDNFKNVNDSLGHAAGDELIRQVARRLQSVVAPDNTVARLGGDEFAILQPAHDDSDSAALLANRLLETISEPYNLAGQRAIIETSIGIALAADHESAEQLLKSADLALYRAKAEGRNIFRIYEPHMGLEARSRYELEAELRTAIAAGDFDVLYQPLMDVTSRQVCGVEALVRWRHPERGIILPDAFIPIAESTGLIVAMGEHILRKACSDAATLDPHIKVSVNLSPVQFRKGDIVGVVSDTLTESGLAPERLELEITESVLLQRDASNLSKLHELRTLGVSIALDDFGTGYSSLSYLQTFPFDKIKIDRSFISGIMTHPDCAAIVCAVTGLARSLNIVTAAEGVETPEQLELLKAAGCQQAQGYLFSRPVPVDEVRLHCLTEPHGKTAAA